MNPELKNRFRGPTTQVLAVWCFGCLWYSAFKLFGFLARGTGSSVEGGLLDRLLGLRASPINLYRHGMAGSPVGCWTHFAWGGVF